FIDPPLFIDPPSYPPPRRGEGTLLRDRLRIIDQPSSFIDPRPSGCGKTVKTRSGTSATLGRGIPPSCELRELDRAAFAGRAVSSEYDAMALVRGLEVRPRHGAPRLQRVHEGLELRHVRVVLHVPRVDQRRLE